MEEIVKIEVFKTKAGCGAAAADRGADILKQTIAAKGRASLIVATGASQFDFMKALTQKDGIEWHNTTMYHLDEYIGFTEDQPASFRRYLNERLVDVCLSR
jgi:glucosamine-6-phosphate deaminase